MTTDNKPTMSPKFRAAGWFSIVGAPLVVLATGYRVEPAMGILWGFGASMVLGILLYG